MKWNGKIILHFLTLCSGLKTLTAADLQHDRAQASERDRDRQAERETHTSNYSIYIREPFGGKQKGHNRDERRGRKQTRTIFSVEGPMGEKSDNPGPDTDRKAIIHEK